MHNEIFLAKTRKNADTCVVAQDSNVHVREDLSNGSEEVDCEEKSSCNGLTIYDTQ
jgi:hypothetical protein